MPMPELGPRNNGPKSLYNSARDVLVKYINTMDNVGDLDYRILEPVLRKVTSPLQLKKLETNSPQLAGDDAELWRKFIARDFGADAVAKYVPSNPRSWSKVYDKHARDAAKSADAAKAALKSQFNDLRSQKAGMRSQLVAAATLPPLKRKVPWGGFGGGGGSSGGSGWGKSRDNWDTKAGSKTKNIVQRARREAKELSVFRGRNSKLAVPMHELKAGRVSRDMVAKVEKRQKMVDAVEKPPPMPEVLRDEEERENEAERRAREDRLRAAMGQERRVATGGMEGGPKVVRRGRQADPFFRPTKMARRA
ncbi:RNA polymerase II transcription factor SIII subunit A-domain-containing protein [Geopyxis carbonaria]|nr:RNA polymerase II transcription factor SIII subunit A-domain-containing protein [Geopyxis carbonaria]